MQSLERLNDQFAIDGELRFCDRGDGFIVAEIANSECSAAVALNGAHLLSWQPAGQAGAIWLSEDARFENGRSIRGGIPVCWPWFGAHASDNSLPAHGFARTTLWHVTSAASDRESTTLTLALQTDDKHPMWPHASRVELEIRAGNLLEMTLTTENHAAETITIGQALHTYFRIGDIADVHVSGLDGRPYLDKPDGFKRKQQSGDIGFPDEVDRVYLESADDCLIVDQQMQRTIRIEKSGSRSTVVWNPGPTRSAEMGDLGPEGYRRMLCVESANAAEDVVAIEPGASHSLSVRYSLESL